jgi:hypothetical protein
MVTNKIGRYHLSAVYVGYIAGITCLIILFIAYKIIFIEMNFIWTAVNVWESKEYSSNFLIMEEGLTEEEVLLWSYI